MVNKIDFSKYKELKSQLQKATLCFLLRDDQILLAMKKRGFAAGKWNGVGGKMDERDKSIEMAAIRETQEEIDVTPKSLVKVATLSFYFPDPHFPGQQVSVFVVTKWNGTPTESEEMAPKWFNVDEIPYDQMWEDDKFWLPKILKGEKVEGDFVFDENQKMIGYKLRAMKH